MSNVDDNKRILSYLILSYTFILQIETDFDICWEGEGERDRER